MDISLGVKFHSTKKEFYGIPMKNNCLCCPPRRFVWKNDPWNTSDLSKFSLSDETLVKGVLIIWVARGHKWLSLGLVFFLYFKQKVQSLDIVYKKQVCKPFWTFLGLLALLNPKSWLQDATVSLVARAACAARAESRGAFAWRGRHPSTPGSE